MAKVTVLRIDEDRNIFTLFKISGITTESYYECSQRWWTQTVAIFMYQRTDFFYKENKWYKIEVFKNESFGT